jgi:hypothetical protein
MPDHRFPNPTPVANDPVGALVGEFVQEKKKEHQEEKARMAKRKRSPFVVPLLVVVCLATWIAPSLMPPREESLSPETLEQGARLTLYLASLRVRGYLDTHKRLPADLTQAGVDTAGIVYTRNADSMYELSTRVQGTRLVYRSTLPDSVFLGPKLRIKGIS